MVCRDCKFMELCGDTGLYICSNEQIQNYGEYTGLLCEDECEDGEELCQNSLTFLES